MVEKAETICSGDTISIDGKLFIIKGSCFSRLQECSTPWMSKSWEVSTLSYYDNLSKKMVVHNIKGHIRLDIFVQVYCSKPARCMLIEKL